MLRNERKIWSAGAHRVAGVDEAGRGPLAGPVVAAAVMLSRAFAESEEFKSLAGLTDSKKLSESRRERFFDVLEEAAEVDVGIGVAGVEEIDRINILRATHVAMRRAVAALHCLPDHLLIDGRPVDGLPCESTAIVRGDALSLSVAAASVIAKVVRDRHMRELDRLYPEYGFARHKGYGTSEHIQALLEHGPCPIHRHSFRPVREAAEIRRRAGDA